MWRRVEEDLLRYESRFEELWRHMFHLDPNLTLDTEMDSYGPSDDNITSEMSYATKSAWLIKKYCDVRNTSTMEALLAEISSDRIHARMKKYCSITISARFAEELRKGRYHFNHKRAQYANHPSQRFGDSWYEPTKLEQDCAHLGWNFLL